MENGDTLIKEEWNSGIRILVFSFLCAFSACNPKPSDQPRSASDPIVELNSSDKINGVSFTSPSNPCTGQWANDVRSINANWVAIIPYGYVASDGGTVFFDQNRQWWGERPDGSMILMSHAKKADLKIMLKPQVWVLGSWPGQFVPATESLNEDFKKSYKEYLLTFATIADSLNIDIFCIGTEFKRHCIDHPEYWKNLIRDIRKVYKGKLTYAANWDSYDKIPIWKELDYIGIDAYFPLSEKKNPDVSTLVEKWKPIKEQIRKTSDKFNKPILFTEYGYRSTPSTTWKQWENDFNFDLPVDLGAQKDAYEAFFRTVYLEPWFAGGFLWKWYHNDASIIPENNSDYTPQNKPAEKLIKSYFSKK